MTENEAYEILWEIIDPLRDSGGWVDFSDWGPAEKLIRIMAKAVTS